MRNNFTFFEALIIFLLTVNIAKFLFDVRVVRRMITNFFDGSLSKVIALPTIAIAIFVDLFRS